MTTTQQSPALLDAFERLRDALYHSDSDPRRPGRLAVPHDSLPVARAGLTRLLLETRALCRHIEWLEERYRSRFPYPRSRRDYWPGEPFPAAHYPTAFRENAPLPEEEALEVAEGGLEVLDEEKTAALVLNPFALWDLADLISILFPARWIPAMEQIGREVMAEAGLKRRTVGKPMRTRGSASSGVEVELALAGMMSKGGAVAEPQMSGHWTLGFDESPAVQRRLAEIAFGDSGRAFTLTLYQVPVEGRSDVARAEMEISPVPSKNDLSLTVVFPAVAAQTFVLAVPPELKADPSAEPRLKTRSTPSDPLPAAAFLFTDGDWREEGGRPQLVLR